MHKCDNDLNNGGLSECRIFREEDGIPSLQEALMEFSLTEVSCGEDRIKSKKVKVKGK